MERLNDGLTNDIVVRRNHAKPMVLEAMVLEAIITAQTAAATTQAADQPVPTTAAPDDDEASISGTCHVTVLSRREYEAAPAPQQPSRSSYPDAPRCNPRSWRADD